MKKSGESWIKIQLSSAFGEHPFRVHCILDDANGHVWPGTDGNGLFLKEKDKEIQQLSS